MFELLIALLIVMTVVGILAVFPLLMAVIEYVSARRALTLANRRMDNAHKSS